MAQQSKIVVVGAGPTGLTLACELARLGVACRLLDQSHRPNAHSRAIGVSARSLEVLDRFGAAAPLIAVGQRMDAANFYSRGTRVGRLTTAAVSGTRFPFLLALPQTQTEQVLRQRFSDLGGTLESDARVTAIEPRAGGPVRLTVETSERIEIQEAHWVVGADGARSIVREKAGIPWIEEPLEVEFTIVDAFVEAGPTLGEGHYYFSPEGLLVVIPLPDGSYRFAATDRSPRAGEPVADLESLRRVARTRMGAPVVIRELRDAGWGGSRVQIRPRIAQTLRSGSCLLAGDAAHVFSPVGGQGMNSGIQDAHNLAWKLTLVSTGRASASLLDTYSAERLPVARALMKASNNQTRLATIESRLGIAARNLFLSFASKSGRLDRKLAPTLTQLAIDYAGSSRLAQRDGQTDTAGMRLPNAILLNEKGESMSVFDLAGPWFTAIALSWPSSGGGSDPLATQLQQRYGNWVTVLAVDRDGSAPSKGPRWVDRDGTLATFIGRADSALILVRPDAHVGVVVRPQSLDRFWTYLDLTLDAPDIDVSTRPPSPRARAAEATTTRVSDPTV